MRTRHLALLALLAAACDGAPTPPEPRPATLSPAESRAVAMQMDETARALVQGGHQGALFNGAAGDSTPRPYTFSYTYDRVRQCALGGTVRFQGTAEGRHDPAARDFQARYTATRTEAACKIALQDGGTLQIDGAPNLSMSSEVSFRNAALDRPIVTTHAGGFHWARGTGESGTCTIDLRSTFMRTGGTSVWVIRGTACGRVVSDSVVRTHG